MLKKIICLFFLFSINIVYGEGRIISERLPNHPYYRNHRYYNNHALNSDLNALEKYALNRTYSRENPLRRLERLEELAFGSTQYGSNLEARYKNAEAAILSRPNYTNSKRSILKNVADYFSGQPTGISPSLIPKISNGYSYQNTYNSMLPNYNAQSFYPYGTQKYDSISNGIWGGGYSTSNSSYGNGSSIRILP